MGYMKRLIFRLSSLGDLILSQSVLEPPFAGETHWVVAKEFEALVLGNPKIAKVWAFDRRQARGLSAWISFLAELRQENFDEVLDLHSTLRTALARAYFRLFAPKTRWRKVSKERGRRIGYEGLKRIWPAALRPRHFARKCALLAGGYGNERPNLRWMIGKNVELPLTRLRIGVVPSSAWIGKEWPVDQYLQWTKRHLGDQNRDELILLGTDRDRSALALREALIREGVTFTDAIGKYGFPELAALLATCATVVGSDTGLLHLAEAVGTPVVTIFGPTRNDFGFGPLDEKSKPVQTPLWCSPCSKDGSLCFRPIRRYECLHRIDAQAVENAMKMVLPTKREIP
jgi:ADP-heptose:LPS heptosyltransferase